MADETPFDTIRIFEKGGESFIGKFIVSGEETMTQYNSAVAYYNDNLAKISGLDFDDAGVLVICNPAKIEWNLTNTGSGKSSIEWKLVPLFYKDLTTDTSRFFFFKADDITLSTVTSITVNADLLAAYKDIVGA